MLYYQSFSVTGSANSTVQDSGLTSTETERRKLISVIVNVSGHAGNIIEGWLEREKIVDMIDYPLDTGAASGTDSFISVSKIKKLDVDVDIPIGQTFKIAMKCGATNKNLYGAYVYEIV